MGPYKLLELHSDPDLVVKILDPDLVVKILDPDQQHWRQEIEQAYGICVLVPGWWSCPELRKNRTDFGKKVSSMYGTCT
jgi:hypothetical protein